MSQHQTNSIRRYRRAADCQYVSDIKRHDEQKAISLSRCHTSIADGFIKAFNVTCGEEMACIYSVKRFDLFAYEFLELFKISNQQGIFCHSSYKLTRHYDNVCHNIKLII